MATLNLFPARVAFVNPDGTLTNEAYRALQIIFGRVGGALGDSGTDVFGQVFGVTSEASSAVQNDVAQPSNPLDVVYPDTTQPATFTNDFYGDVVQSPASSKDFAGIVYPDVMQTENGFNGTITSASLVGRTITVQNGIIISFA